MSDYSVPERDIEETLDMVVNSEKFFADIYYAVNYISHLYNFNAIDVIRKNDMDTAIQHPERCIDPDKEIGFRVYLRIEPGKDLSNVPYDMIFTEYYIFKNNLRDNEHEHYNWAVVKYYFDEDLETACHNLGIDYNPPSNIESENTKDLCNHLDDENVYIMYHAYDQQYAAANGNSYEPTAAPPSPNEEFIDDAKNSHAFILSPLPPLPEQSWETTSETTSETSSEPTAEPTSETIPESNSFDDLYRFDVYVDEGGIYLDECEINGEFMDVEKMEPMNEVDEELYRRALREDDEFTPSFIERDNSNYDFELEMDLNLDEPAGQYTLF